MDLGIAGKWALVCGSSKGLGLGCARALAAEGVNVVLVARGEAALVAAAEALRVHSPRKVPSLVKHVTADIATAEGRARALAQRPHYDIVVTNAGGPPPGDFRDWDRAAWIAAIEANMLAPIELMKATVDSMAERGFGRVVNITSTSVRAPLQNLGLSNGARSGLTGFVAGIARSPALAGANVTINNLLPGTFDTDRLRGGLSAAAVTSGKPVGEVADARRRTIPAARFGTPDEFGAACAFLCSVQASYVTGQNWVLDGGAFPGSL